MTYKIAFLGACAAVALLAGCDEADTTAAAVEVEAPADVAEAAPAAVSQDITVPGGLVLGESLTSDAAGNVYIGSIANGAILRAAPGETSAAPFIDARAAGAGGIFGVLAHDESQTLWACSSNFGPPADGAAPQPAALYAFDLANGDLRGSFPFPGDGSFCNDMAVGADGSVYATDTNAMHVVRLAPGAAAPEVWSAEGAFGPAGGVLDGIAVVGGRVIVNTLATNKLFAVEIAADGAAGAVTDLTLDNAIQGPDGMRSFGGNSVLIAEGGAGRLSRAVIDGAAATVTGIQDGITAPVAVTVVGDTAYVLEGQFGAMGAGPDTVVPDAKAVAVPVGQP